MSGKKWSIFSAPPTEDVSSGTEESRRDLRYPAHDVVLIYWSDPFGFPCESSAIIRDVSARGFGIETDQDFPVGQPLCIRTAERTLDCIVRHVQEYPSTYIAGLEIVATSDGSTHESSLANLAASLKS